MQTERSVEVDRPIAEVFDFTTHKVAEWSRVVVEEELIDETPDGVGTTFHVVTAERGKRMGFAGIVTQHEPPTRHAVHMKGKSFNIDALYRFEDLGGRTRITQRSTVTGKGLSKVAFAVFGRWMQRSSRDALEQELTSLKRSIEDRSGDA